MSLINYQGQQQRVAIARAIINKPKFIIADEPTGALDSKTSDDIMDLFIQLNQNHQTTVIMVTHDRKVAEKSTSYYTYFRWTRSARRGGRMKNLSNIIAVSFKSILKQTT